MAITTLETAEFAPYFRSREGRLGRDEALMRSVFELRFQIYCLECGFLPTEDYPERREIDEHDINAAHFCASNLKGELVGYVRLVRPDAERVFPFQHHCPQLIDGITLPPAAQSVEISRLMVREDYRRRKGDVLAGVTTDESHEERPTERRDNSPQILLSMYRQMYAFSLQNDIRYWFAAMERSLARVLVRMGFAFRQVGPPTDYYGPVAPYLADLRELEARVGASNPALLTWLNKSDA